MGGLTCRLILSSHDGWTVVWRGPLTAACVIGRGTSKLTMLPHIFAASSRTCFSIRRGHGRSLAAQENGLQGRHYHEQDERADEHASDADSRQGRLTLTA